jgi:hypothetical protein
MKVAYISDLHLEFLADNAIAKFNTGTRWSQEKYDEILSEIILEPLDEIKPDFAVIAGDFSHDPERVINILKLMDNKSPVDIYITLGNHDYWDWNKKHERRLHKIEERYPLGSYPEDGSIGADLGETSATRIVERGFSIEELEQWYKQQLNGLKKIKLLMSGDIEHFNDLYIIGDCGFTGYSRTFGASQGVYRGILKNPFKDKELSDRWLQFFKGFIDNHINDNVLVITHTPPQDWGCHLSVFDGKLFGIAGHVHDCHHGEAQQVVTDRYKGDAGNGYYTSQVDWKILEI